MTRLAEDSYSNSNKRIARNTVFLTFRMIVVLFVNLFTTKVLLNELGVEDYGIYNVVGGLVAMLSFLNVSMSTCIQRFYNFELGRNGIEGAQKVHITSVQIQLVLGLFIIIITETIGLWYLKYHMVIPEGRLFAAQVLFQLSVLSLLLNIFQVPFIAAIVAHEELDFYALVSIIDVILKLSIAFVIKVAPGDHLISFGSLMAMLVLIDLIAYLLYSRMKFPEVRLKRFFDKELFKSMFFFSSWNIFGTFATMMKEQGVNMVINLFFGPAINAARGVSYQVMGGLNGFAANVSMTTRPQIVKSYAQGDTERCIKLFFISSKLCFMAVFLFALPIIIEIHYVLSLWLGDNVPEYTGLFTIWVLLAAFISNLNGPTSGVVHATGNMKKYQLVNSFVSLSVVPMSYIAYRYGAPPESAFIIVFLITSLCQVLSIIILRSLVCFSVKKYIKDVCLSLFLISFLSFFIAMIPHWCMNEGFLRFACVTIVSIIAETVLFFIIAINKTERSAVISIIKAKASTIIKH